MKKINGKLAAVLSLLSAVSVKAFAAPASANPLTGDEFNMPLCITLMAVSAVGVIVLAVLLLMQKKKKKAPKQEEADIE